MENKAEIKRFALMGVIAVLLIFVYQLQTLRPNIIEKLAEHGINYNLWAYAGVIVASFIACFIIDRIKINNKTAEKRLQIILIVVFLGYLFASYALEKEAFPKNDYGLLRWRVNPLLWAVMLGAVSFLIFTPLIRRSFNEVGKNVVLRYGSILISSLLAGALSYAPNMYADALGEVIHIDAYTNSIINVLRHVPYSDRAQSVYGHYGILYLPLEKLLGSNTYGIMVSVAVVAFITFAISGIVLDKLIDKDVLFMIALLAMLRIAVVYRVTGNYFQVFPHRMLFPALAILLVIIEHEKKMSFKKSLFFEILIGTAAFVWNIETGVVCVATYGAVRTLDRWQWKIGTLIKKIAYVIALVVGCFALSYVFVCLYNLLVGGEWLTMSTYIYPLGVKSYMEDILGTEFQMPVFFYVFYIFVFAVAAFPVAVKHFLSDTEMSFKDKVFLSCGVSGILAMVYYINRQAYLNVTIGYIQLIVIMVVEAAGFLKAPNKNKLTLSFVSLCLLSMFSVECVISVGQSIDNRTDTVWDVESLNKDLEDFARWKRGDEVGVGIGVPQLYFYTGDDNGIYMTDGADFFESYDYLRERLEGENSVIISESFVKEFEREYDYHRVRKFYGRSVKLYEYAK